MSEFEYGLEGIRGEADEAWHRFGTASMGGDQMTRTERLAVLLEEVGEVAREVVTELRNLSGIESDRHGYFESASLAHELAQVGACAAMWIEAEMRSRVPAEADSRYKPEPAAASPASTGEKTT